MSDSEEYEYEYDSDEQYNSAEEDDQQAMDGDDVNDGRSAARDLQIKLENTFYEADDFRQRGETDQAMAYFTQVVELEKPILEEEGLASVKWSFQALDHMVKLSVQRHQWALMVQYYQHMLTFLSFVTRNESTDAISSILDAVSMVTSEQNSKYTSQMYEITLEHLKSASNDRLWFSMNVKLGKLYLEIGEFTALRRLLDQLYTFCQTSDGSQDNSKATAQMEVYALDIQWCGATKNKSRLRSIYPKTVDVDAALCDPRVLGIIREEGGKMCMEEGDWTKAYNEFFESFRNYQEAGNARATQCLKYVVLANMLASSDINPFDSREAKVYQDVEEIAAMLLLRGAYESNDIVAFEKVLKNPKYKLLSDPIMMKYLNPLIRNIRCQVLKKLVRPYRTVQLAFLARSMNMQIDEVEEIATHLIQRGELPHAKVDQIRRLLVVQPHEKDANEDKTYQALENWLSALELVHPTIATRVAA